MSRVRVKNGIAGACMIGALTLASVVGTSLAINPGPDIIVGDLPDVGSYGTDAGSGKMAYSIGTTSCNNGNIDCQWVAGTNQHPVIGQNLYRINAAGQFQQIGQSWVKHGFTALTQSLCNTCSGRGGAVLGVGCSDPYGSGLNGSQGGLGPRSEINAYTGAFPYPSTWPAFSGNLARRLVVNTTDVDPAQNAGATYLIDAQYISNDDALAGNGWNNASWRRVTFTANSTFTMNLYSGTGAGAATTRQVPAITGWPSFVPSAVVFPTDIPGDGRLWIGHNTTNLGNGTWRYDYVIHNLTSDRCPGSFSVPIPAGKTVSNLTFSAPFSHSGEPFSNAAWTSSSSGGAVTFTVPQTFAQNANANAVRWGTSASFSFVIDAAPATGSASIGLFKPGSGNFAGVSSIPVVLRTPAGSTTSVTAPVFDECAGTLPLHAGQNAFSTLGATGGGSVAGCSSATTVQNDSWFTYSFNAATGCNGNITFDTCGSGFDTSLSVYSGTTCPPTGAPLACSDNDGTCAASTGSSSVTMTLTPGATYLVRVGSPTGATGNLILNVTVPNCLPATGGCCNPVTGACTVVTGSASCISGNYQGDNSTCSPNPCPQPPPPANDLCANAIAVGDFAAGSPRVIGTNVNATSGSPAFSCGGGLLDVWYKYTPASNATVTFDTCTSPANGATYDTVIAVTSSCTGSDLVCNDDACGTGTQSSVSRALTAGTTYYIRVGGYQGAVGQFVLTVTGGGGVLTGTCCRGATCTTGLTAANCVSTTSNGAPITASFISASSSCNTAGSNTTPCCHANFDKSSDGVQVADIFAFLSAFFANSPYAVIQSTSSGAAPAGAPGVPDIFNFLSAWFAAGCS